MIAGAVEELVEKAGGCALIDGGFATQLEALGADINDPLWSAACLITKPHLIKEVHMQYLEAGADVIISSSYQATIPGFLARGILLEEAEGLLRTSVQLALEARDEFWKSTLRKSKPVYNRALVAASIGSYGAYLADGSEYSGSYGDDITAEKLKDFHRRRLQVLASAGPDLIAFEAIPNKMEAQALAELLEEENIQVPSWICFSSVDGKNLCSGESFEDCLQVLNASEKVAIVGVNCTPPQFIEGIIREFKKVCNFFFVQQFPLIHSRRLISFPRRFFNCLKSEYDVLFMLLFFPIFASVSNSKQTRQLQCTQTAARFGMGDRRGGWNSQPSALVTRASTCSRKGGKRPARASLEDAAGQHLRLFGLFPRS